MNDIFVVRFVVFIDILGFSSLVAAASRDPDGEKTKQVDSALTMIQEMQRFDDQEFETRLNIPGYRSQIFSDCILISVPPDSQSVSKLFVELSRLTLELMSIGIWLRGGMSVGSIARKEQTPWGPAIVEAYKIESEIAVNPRIALSKSAYEFVRDKMVDKEKDGLIVRDEDGVWALAPFVWALRASYNNQVFLTERLGNQIKVQLESAFYGTVDSPRVFRKIDWLSMEWDNQVKPKNGYPTFDCRTVQGKKRDLADIFQRGLDDAEINLDGGTF